MKIVLLLNVMKPSDILEYEGIQEHLSLKEIENRLYMRRGFTREAISHALQQLEKGIYSS